MGNPRRSLFAIRTATPLGRTPDRRSPMVRISGYARSVEPPFRYLVLPLARSPNPLVRALPGGTVEVGFRAPEARPHLGGRPMPGPARKR
ncbi:hypothetical protein FAGKG844_50070 [Frankia sp. AgKG'84/4]